LHNIGQKLAHNTGQKLADSQALHQDSGI